MPLHRLFFIRCAGPDQRSARLQPPFPSPSGPPLYPAGIPSGLIGPENLLHDPVDQGWILAARFGFNG